MDGSGIPKPAPKGSVATAAEAPGTLRHRLLVTGLGGLAAGLVICGLAGHMLFANALVENQQREHAEVAHVFAAVLSEVDPLDADGVLEGLASQESVERMVLRAGDHVVFESPPGMGAAFHVELSAVMTTLLAAAFEPPVSTSRVSVEPSSPIAGAPPAAPLTLELATRGLGHASSLSRVDLYLLLVLLIAFAVVGPLIAVAVIRQTAPLSSLREAVLVARQAGRAGGAASCPVRQGDSELLVLCRAIDALGADVADARIRLFDANEELTQQVKSRTAELSQTNRQLELEAEDKDHFLRAVTHDLNAPLRNIDGLSKLLLSKHADELSEGASARLERISINVKQQHELINDLLELSRLRTKPHRSVELRLGELVDEVAGGLGFDLENANIEFEMTGEWPVIFAERNRFRQVFQNLIDNAIKYMMDSETRKITVDASRERDFGADIFEGVDSYRFAVRDTGRGIAEEDVASVFRVFSRSIHSGTHDVAGRGVGLACVDAIVRRHGGRVGVESRLGEGSTFWFTVPVASVSSLAADAEGERSPPVDEVETPADPPRVPAEQLAA